MREDAGGRCGYCHTPEGYIGMPLEYDHLYPEALLGPTERDNLWFACTRCNDFKGDRISGIDPETGKSIALFIPRTQLWAEHFDLSASGRHILGLTPTGRATVAALRLNNDFIVVTRQFWVEAGWWPPSGER